jgi:hypothetical protein
MGLTTDGVLAEAEARRSSTSTSDPFAGGDRIDGPLNGKPEDSEDSVGGSQAGS